MSNSTGTNSDKNRVLYYDMLRILACFFVIFNHQDGFLLFQTSTGIKQWAYMFITMFTKINVPLFFMISGTLLLRYEDYDGEYIRKKVIKSIITLVLFEVAISIGDIVSGKFSILKFIDNVISGKVSGAGPYWYMYAYISILLFLPAYTSAVNRMPIWLFGLVFLFFFIRQTLLPILNLIVAINGGSFNVELSSYINTPFNTSQAFFYPMIGFYIDKKIRPTINSNRLMVVLLITFLYIESLCTYYSGTILGKLDQSYTHLFDYMIAILVFLIVKDLFQHEKFKLNNTYGMITMIGPLTYGIYMIDPVLKKYLYGLFLFQANNRIPTIFLSVIWCIISMAIGGGDLFYHKENSIYK